MDQRALRIVEKCVSERTPVAGLETEIKKQQGGKFIFRAKWDPALGVSYAEVADFDPRGALCAPLKMAEGRKISNTWLDQPCEVLNGQDMATVFLYLKDDRGSDYKEIMRDQPGALTRIVGVEIPEGICPSPYCRSAIDEKWRTEFPAQYPPGIAIILEPVDPSKQWVENSPYNDFPLHRSQERSEPAPLDLSADYVLYEFDKPTVVSGVEIIQHRNGIAQLEGFVGSSSHESEMTSLGVASISGCRGASPDPGCFNNGDISQFRFTRVNSGRFFMFKIRRLTYDRGYAVLRAYPLDTTGRRIKLKE
ncbi:MAG: hypothetical protein L0387_41600 [Acidobacteria bacterium]|nr:hypothetical protein [Acidobacteriota bacterium]